jgi:hypothetical protein
MLRCPPTRIELKSDDGRAELHAARAARAREADGNAAPTPVGAGAAASAAAAAAAGAARVEQTRERVGVRAAGQPGSASR